MNAGTAGITSEVAAHRARTVVLHNSRLVCILTMAMGVICAFLGVCMMLMIVSLLTPLSAIGFMRVLAAAQWGLGGVVFVMGCPALWKWGLRMLHKRVKMDERGVDFVLGTKKEPIELFMPWENIASITQKRVDNGQQFTVTGADGSFAQFSSTSFFRPMRVARMIAERAGVGIGKG
jgi:hypothetical protein